MTNQVTFAAIHGTILSIIIGLSSVYVIYFFNISNELEQNAISEALKVNKIETNKAWYRICVFATDYFQNWKKHFDKLDVDSDTQNRFLIYRLLRLIKHKHIVYDNVDPAKGFGTKISDEWLLEYRKLNSLSDIEEILCIMTIIRLSKPFQQKLDLEYSGGISLPATVNFQNKLDVHSWLKNFTKLGELTFETEIYNLKELLKNLKWSEGRLFVKMSENLSRKYAFEEFGLNPDAKTKSLTVDFVDDIKRISDIFYSTVSYTRRLSKLDEKIPHGLTVKVGLILSIIAFYSAVLYPLAISNVRPLFYVHVPLGFYLIFSAYILWKVFIK